MDRKKILYVTTEMTPYFPENPLSNLSLQMPKSMRSRGNDVRIFMPRFGTINERRHQLHEVIRLSGMNLIINDIDQPLIIKVASVPNERLQVYFIDNDEYFKRKYVFKDKDGELFEDNDERAIFFAKGVLETLKKLNWKPDIVNVMGWMSSVLPVYLREYYKNDPFFKDTKIAVSLTDSTFTGELKGNIVEKLAFDNLNGSVAELLGKPNHTNLIKSALQFADAAIKIDEIIEEDLLKYLMSNNIPILENHLIQEDVDAYAEFCEAELLNEE